MENIHNLHHITVTYEKRNLKKMDALLSEKRDKETRITNTL